MTISFLSVHTYRKLNRIIVQYYNSGNEEKCLCPECGWKGDLPSSSHEISCLEILCASCGIPLAMISSKLPSDSLESRCI